MTCRLLIVISTSPDIVVITETFLDDSIVDGELFPQGYYIFWRDRS